jgi:hypothetical protein
MTSNLQIISAHFLQHWALANNLNTSGYPLAEKSLKFKYSIWNSFQAKIATRQIIKNKKDCPFSVNNLILYE